MAYKDPEARKANDKRYRENNRDKFRASGKRWRERHPEKELLRHQQQYAEMRRTCYWRRLLQQAKRRAKEKNQLFELTQDWAATRWTGACEVTNLPFHTGNNRHILSPSIDRIDSSQGYTQENSRFVIWGFNALRCSNTDAEALVAARAIVSGLEKAF